MDVYQHAERRAIQNSKKIIQLQNKNPKQRLKETDAEITRITDLDTAIPIEYEPNTIAH